MGTAAEALTLSALRLLQRPDLLQRAEGERAAQHGERYRCPLPENVKPPVDGIERCLGMKEEPAWHGDCPHTMQAP